MRSSLVPTPFVAAIALISLSGLSASGLSAARPQAAVVEAAAGAASLAFETVAPDPGAAPDGPRPVMQVQVVLDRLGFSPGVIDGQAGKSLTLALRGFQTAHGLPASGALDPATRTALERWRDVPATRLVRIPAAFAEGPFQPDLPREAAAQADFPALGYRDLMEALAERFHTTPATLAALNRPSGKAGHADAKTADGVIRVPDVPDIDTGTLPADARGWNATLQTLAVAPRQPRAARVVVDRSEAALKVYDAQDRLIAQFPATMGSRHDSLPLGDWKIQGISRNPDFHYNPKLFWDASADARARMLKPGPNGPVGVVWIDLSKAHYGIHGTSEPQTIGRSQSHGCVRLTNWDAARLAQMIDGETPAIFEA